MEESQIDFVRPGASIWIRPADRSHSKQQADNFHMKEQVVNRVEEAACFFISYETDSQKDLRETFAGMRLQLNHAPVLKNAQC